MSGRSKEAIIAKIEAVTKRGQAKRTLMARFKDERRMNTRKFPAKETEASQRRKKNVELWINEAIPIFQRMKKQLTVVSKLCYSIAAGIIRQHEQYIKEKILTMYKLFYEKSDSLLAQIFRTAICYLDEMLNIKDNGRRYQISLRA